MFDLETFRNLNDELKYELYKDLIEMLLILNELSKTYLYQRKMKKKETNLLI